MRQSHIIRHASVKGKIPIVNYGAALICGDLNVIYHFMNFFRRIFAQGASKDRLAIVQIRQGIMQNS